MVARKKTTGYEEDLYICMHDAEEKRKNILMGIKTSLIMQGEAEKLADIRARKKATMAEIQNSMKKINKMYQDLKKNLPNVKNIIPYTEKELKELETQIYNLKETIRVDRRDVKTKENIKDKIEEFEKDTKPKPSKETVTQKVRGEEAKKKAATKKEVKKVVEKPKMIPVKDNKPAKIDRIKNNLKVIESKLKHI